MQRLDLELQSPQAAPNPERKRISSLEFWMALLWVTGNPGRGAWGGGRTDGGETISGVEVKVNLPKMWTFNGVFWFNGHIRLAKSPLEVKKRKKLKDDLANHLSHSTSFFLFFFTTCRVGLSLSVPLLKPKSHELPWCHLPCPHRRSLKSLRASDWEPGWIWNYWETKTALKVHPVGGCQDGWVRLCWAWSLLSCWY